MATDSPEYFGGADEVAGFLQLRRRRMKGLARSVSIPAHSIGEGARKVWRFLLRELYQHMVDRENGADPPFAKALGGFRRDSSHWHLEHYHGGGSCGCQGGKPNGSQI